MLGLVSTQTLLMIQSTQLMLLSSKVVRIGHKRVTWVEGSQYLTEKVNTVSLIDLDKLNLVIICNGGLILGLKPISTNLPAASKNDAFFKSGQN